MNVPLQYITDAKGKKVSVVISYSDWLEYEAGYEKLKNKLVILSSMKSGIKEVKDARKRGVELQNLEDFLNEC